MPHIRLTTFEIPTLPIEAEGVSFTNIFKNDYKDPDYLVKCLYKEKAFFIWIKPSEGGYLLKAEKATRPTVNYYLQHALKTFAQLTKGTILSSNIPDTLKTVHLDEEAGVLKTIHFFTQNFPLEKPLVIEVGFGSGRHLLYQAQKNPDKLYIGIEIHQPSIEQVIKQISILGIKNILLLNYDARLFMEFVPSNIVQQIFVHFPVPWDKKPIRRVISTAFIKESVRVLDPKGTLELRTDSENYFTYALETFLEANQLDINVKKNLDIPISSKYEARWKRQEKNIYDIHMLGLVESAPLELHGDFDFKDVTLTRQKVQEIAGTTIKTDKGFIHFERHYMAPDGTKMLRLSMGSFERPEHLYLQIVGESKLAYFPAHPIYSQANLIMHQELLKALHG